MHTIDWTQLLYKTTVQRIPVWAKIKKYTSCALVCFSKYYVFIYVHESSAAKLRHRVMSVKLNSEHTLAYILENFSHQPYRSIRWIHLSIMHFFALAIFLFISTSLSLLFSVCLCAHCYSMQIVSVFVLILKQKQSISITKNMAIN